MHRFTGIDEYINIHYIIALKSENHNSYGIVRSHKIKYLKNHSALGVSVDYLPIGNIKDND